MLTLLITLTALGDSIHAGHPALRARPLAPGPDTVIAERIVDGVHTILNTAIRTVKREGANLRIRVDFRTPDGNGNTIDEQLVRASDYALIEERVTAVSDSGYVRIENGHATGWNVPARKPKVTFDQPLPAPTLGDDGISPWWLGVLPLKVGYEGTLTIYNLWTPGLKVTAFKVAARETVNIGSKSYDCWRLEGEGWSPKWRRRTWIDAATGVIVQERTDSDSDKTVFWTHIAE